MSTATATTKNGKIYPNGLFTLFFVNGLNMISLIMINALLVLYITHSLHIPLKHAYNIFAAFGSLFFSFSLVGGYLGGRYDHKMAIIAGGLLAGCGSYLIAIPHLKVIFFGLSCYIVGSGLMIPNLFCMLGKLFKKDDPLRDSGFTVGYIGLNIGAFIAATSSGFIANYISYSAAYLFSSTCIFISLGLFLIRFKHLDFHQDKQTFIYKPQLNLRNLTPMLITMLIFIPIVDTLLNHAKISNVILILVGIATAGLITYLALQETGKARRKLFGFLIFTVFSIAFWALYMLAPSALTIFIKYNVDRHMFGFIIPTASVYGLNPFFIITIGTLTSILFLRMSRQGKSMPLRNKFAIGIASMGLGYIMLLTAIQFSSPTGYIAFFWIVLSYFLQTFGELFVSPVGLSMAGSLAPPHLEGFMMGVFQLSTGVAGAISGFLASATVQASPQLISHPTVTNPTFEHFFGLYGSISLGVGILIFLLTPQFKKLWA